MARAKAKKAEKKKGKTAVEVAVKCAYSEIVGIARLKPNPLNPYKHPKKQIKKLADALQKDGWRHCITVSRQSGFIVAGHCRLLAAKSLGLLQIPVDFQDFDSDAHEYSVLVSDNVIAEFNVIDNSMMLEVIKFVDESEIPISRLSLDKEQIKNYSKGAGWKPEPEDDPEPKEPKAPTVIKVKCRAGDYEALKERITKSVSRSGLDDVEVV